MVKRVGETVGVGARRAPLSSGPLPPFGHLLHGGENEAVPAAARLVGAALVNFQADTPRKNGANFLPEFPLLPYRRADEASLAVPRRED